MANTRKDLIIMRNQCIAKHKMGEPLTLEETALAIWNPDTEVKPLTSMAIHKIEKRALLKLQGELKKYGIKSLDDLFENKHREFAHMNCEA